MPVKSIYILNELNLFGYLVKCILGRTPFLLNVDPYFTPTRKVLQKIVGIFVTTGKSRMLSDVCPDLARIQDYYAEIYMYNIFAETEHWANDNFRFSEAERLAGSYSMPFNHAICNLSLIHV